MPLSNAQYDEIMRGYNERQLANGRLTAARKEDVYRRAPRLKEIDAEMASASVASVRRLLDGDTTARKELSTRLELLREEKKALLAELALPENYLEPVCDCPLCHDTGYVNGKKCRCFEQAIINSLYDQSNIRPVLARENFAAFRYDYYSDQTISKVTGLSARETVVRAVKECRHFIDDFDNKPKNLLIYGDTGVGKTFLTNCVAGELLAKGRSVIYFTAFQMFDILSKGVFAKDSDAIDAHRNIFDCDLLIIDDLGTELTNSFTSSQLFLCVNERILRGKSTIISTNLNMNQLMDLYSERTFSRITSNYTVLKLFGDDIRLKKRLQ